MIEIDTHHWSNKQTPASEKIYTYPPPSWRNDYTYLETYYIILMILGWGFVLILSFLIAYTFLATLGDMINGWIS